MEVAFTCVEKLIHVYPHLNVKPNTLKNDWNNATLQHMDECVILPVCFNKERTSISVITTSEIDATTTNRTNSGYICGLPFRQNPLTNRILTHAHAELYQRTIHLETLVIIHQDIYVNDINNSNKTQILQKVIAQSCQFFFFIVSRNLHPITRVRLISQ